MKITIVPRNIQQIIRNIVVTMLIITISLHMSGVFSLSRVFAPVYAADMYRMYGVHDSGGSTSQFFVLNGDNGTVSPLGASHPGYDIEAIDIHPSTGALYAIAGGGGSEDGKLFLVNKTNGALTLMGNTGAEGGQEIVAASFRNDGTLWAFQENRGIVEVNITNGALTERAQADTQGVGDNWEGLAWDLTGQQLYGVQGGTLYRWDPLTHAATELCDNLPHPTEALDVRPDGKLFGGWHNADDDTLSVFEINPDTCTITANDYSIEYNDVESIAFEAVQTTPPPSGDKCALTVTKTATPGEVKPGDEISYTVTLKNTGTANCTGGGVELKEFYDAKTNYVSATPAPVQGNNLWNFGTVEPNEEHVVTIKSIVSSSAKDKDSLTNKVCAWAEQFGSKSEDSNWVCTTVTTKVKISPPPPAGECRLTVEKSDDPDPVAPGATLTYAVKLKNTGDRDCTGGGVELKEFYDARTSFVSANPAPVQGDNLWNFGTVKPDESHEIRITMETGNSLENGDELHNKACAWAEQFGPKSDENNWVCDEETTTVIKLPPSTANLVISKKVTDTNEGPVIANTASMGEQMTYTVELKNTGNAGAEEVMLTDNYDESNVTVIDAAGGMDDTTKIVFPIGVINPGQSVLKTIKVTVKNGMTATTTFENIAFATAKSHPKVTAQVTTTVPFSSPDPTGFDLKLEKSVSPAIITNNQEATFTLTVTNEGTTNGTGITVKDVMPTQLIYVADSSDGDFNNNTGIWTIGNLAVGQSTSTRITVRAGSSGTFENIAEIVTDGGNDDIDSTPNNQKATEDDHDSAILKVNELPGPPGGCASNCGGGGSTPVSKITVIKSVQTPIVTTGAIVTYAFTVSAGGTTDALNVRVVDTLPAGFTFIEGATSSRTWDFGTMDEGTSVTRSYDVLVGPSVSSGSYENLVVATISNGTAPDNRSESRARVEVRAPSSSGPQLIIQKDATVAFTNPDSQIMYNITVKNIGVVTANNVTVADVLPAGFTYTEGNMTMKIFNVGNLAKDETKTFVYTVEVSVHVPAGSYRNIATARADNASSVSDTADVEIREVHVQGFTTLPDTGTGTLNPLAVGALSLLMLIFGGVLAHRFRALLREQSRAQVLVNFVRQ